MFLLDNLYNDLGSKLNMRIELLHVIDHMIYTQQHQNPDIAKQISILYGPSWLSYQKNIRIEFRNGYIQKRCNISSLFLIVVRDLIKSLRNFFKHQPWDLLMFVDEFTAQFDYLIVLRSPYEFIDEENLEQIINTNFKCGCLVSFYDNNFIEIQNIQGNNLLLTRQSIFIEIIFSRILSVPKRRTPIGILVAPNKRLWLVFSIFSRICLGLPKFRWGSSVWGHSESERK